GIGAPHRHGVGEAAGETSLLARDYLAGPSLGVCEPRTAPAAPVARGSGPRARYLAAAVGEVWFAAASSRCHRRCSAAAAGRPRKRTPGRGDQRSRTRTAEELAAVWNGICTPHRYGLPGSSAGLAIRLSRMESVHGAGDYLRWLGRLLCHQP